MKRRDLLRMLGTSMGGAMLVACREPAGPGIFAPLPNGFRFYPIKNSGSSLPGGGTLRGLRFDTSLTDGNEFVYGAVDASDVPGLYGLNLDFSGKTPVVAGETSIIRQGEVLPGGGDILTLRSYDTNHSGSLAIVVNVGTRQIIPDTGDEFGMDAVYLRPAGGAFVLVLEEGSPTSDGHLLGGVFGDIDLHSGHDLLVVAKYLHHPVAGEIPDNSAPDIRPLQGVFIVPGGDPAQARLVMNTESLPGGAVEGIGLIDMHDGGTYVAQVHPASTVDAIPVPSMEGGIDSVPTELTEGLLVQGSIAGTTPRMVSGFATANASTAQASILGPRVGPGNMTAWVTHTSETAMTLYYHGLKVLGSGERTPAGNIAVGMSPPSFGPLGEIYYVAHTDAGHELYTANGSDTALLLARGDRLVGDDRPINSIMLGHTTEHVNSDGKIALTVAFDDGSATLVVGVPA